MICVSSSLDLSILQSDKNHIGRRTSQSFLLAGTNDDRAAESNEKGENQIITASFPHRRCEYQQPLSILSPSSTLFIAQLAARPFFIPSTSEAKWVYKRKAGISNLITHVARPPGSPLPLSPKENPTTKRGTTAMFNFKSKSRAEAQASQSFSDEHDDAYSEDSYLDSKVEKRFVRKLDFILVTWAFFAYLMKVSRWCL